jgi:DNA polymerase-3 subunit delta'
MSRSKDTEEDAEAPHPRATTVFFGHAEAERALLDAYRGGRIAHAWLIGGPHGIGKATLAYRMARFVLANPDPAAGRVQTAQSLTLDDDPVVRRVAAQGHSDLLTLERVINEDTGKLYTVIRVEDVRRSVAFFGSTAGEGGWRVCVVDTADELKHPEAANALLKVLEEPPPRALLLLVANSPSRLLATIRSRCRRLPLRPLATGDVVLAASAALGRDPGDPEVAEAAAVADGSVARALRLLDASAAALRKRVLELLAQLPDPDPRALHALGDALGGSEPQTLAAFADVVNNWLSARLSENAEHLERMARTAEVWEKFNHAARDADIYNLDRKPLVFATFGLLADAARG